MKTWELVFAALVVVLSLQLHVHGVPQVPCYFIFGDSLADNGNNNQLQSLARSNYMPYGIDFPGGPTGRFSNGKTTVHVIAELLGFDDYIPPYVSASGQDILKGVNYASAAGFKVTNAGCFGVGRNNGQITCLPLQTPCQNRNEYLFWDAYHPTKAESAIVAKRAYSAQAALDAYPVDICQLAQI
nr:gdsl esterase/lipase [Quercus suber]